MKLASETIRINPSDPYENLPEDETQGEWMSKAKAAARFDCSERTVETKIQKRIVFSRLVDGNREVWLRHSQPSEKGSDQSAKSIGSSSETNLSNVRNFTETLPNSSVAFPQYTSEPIPNQKCEECESLKGKISLLEEQLKEVEIAKAKLEGQMEGKDDLIAGLRDQLADKDSIIEAKNQTITAKEGAFFLLEQQIDKNALPTMANRIPNISEPLKTHATTVDPVTQARPVNADVPKNSEPVPNNAEAPRKRKLFGLFG